MQPYFLPYYGYFQLMDAVDLFIVYDNIEYTKKGWINRNRMLQRDHPMTFTLPLQRGSDFLDIRERWISPDFRPDRLLAQFRGAYHRAPHFADTMALLDRVIRYPDHNLFAFLHASLDAVREHLELRAEVRVSSAIAVDHTLKGQAKVLAICEAVGATTYINAIGGTGLYARDAFRDRGIELKFLQPEPFVYDQFGASFVPRLSIIDCLMFNGLPNVRSIVATQFQLL
jgi:hypothetical protein